MIDKIKAEADAIPCGKDEKIKALEALLNLAKKERDEALAYGERLRSAAWGVLMNITGMYEWHELENAAQKTTPAALAALKAEWQAEALDQCVKSCKLKVLDGPDIFSDAVLEFAREIRQLAQEAGDE